MCSLTRSQMFPKCIILIRKQWRMSIRVSREPSIVLFVERTIMEAQLEENIRGSVHESFATNKRCSNPEHIVASLKEPLVPAYVASDFAALSTTCRHCRAAIKRKFVASAIMERQVHQSRLLARPHMPLYIPDRGLRSQTVKEVFARSHLFYLRDLYFVIFVQ